MEEKVVTKTLTFLETTDFYLRGFQQNDLPYLSSWLDDKVVTQYLEMGRRPTRQKDIEQFLDIAQNEESAVVFSIIEREEKKPIGYCGLYLIDWVSRRAQINILVGQKEFWDKGIGSRACKILLEYAFSHLNLNSVQLGVNVENKRACKAYEKVGFVLEGQRREFLFCNGEYNDMLVYSILKTEYMG